MQTSKVFLLKGNKYDNNINFTVASTLTKLIYGPQISNECSSIPQHNQKSFCSKVAVLV